MRSATSKQSRRPAAAGLLFCLLAAPAWAFTFETSISRGCHEELALQALERAQWPAEVAVPAAGKDEQVLADNLAFGVPAGADRWTQALLVGVRDNDLRGGSATDFVELSETHNSALLQAEHCLRDPEQDGTAGDVAAIEACRRFIRGEVALALGGGSATGVAASAPVAVTLRYGPTTLELPRYAFHMGRALHALQDSFTHSYRAAGFRRLATVFNYAEPALSSHYQPDRDGLPHESRYDRCLDAEGEPTARSQAALEASGELLAAAAGAGTATERLAAVDGVLDAWVQHQPGCSAGDNWCGGAKEEEPAGGCAAAPAGPLCALALALLATLRRRRVLRGAAPAAAALAIFWVPSLARAAEPAAEAPVQQVAPVPHVAPVQQIAAAQPSLEVWPSSRFKLRLLSGVSVDRGAASVAAGFSVDLGARWSVGLELEYSPWFDVLAGTFSAGTANGYGTVTFRWATLGRFELRTELHAGASVLLFDTPGASAGSVGVVIGASPLRAAVRIGPRVDFEISPEVVLVAPSLRGMPLVYRQYRLMAGFRFGVL